VVSDEVAAYRARYRAKHVGAAYRGWLHFAVTSLGSLAAIAFAASRGRAPTLGQLAALPVFFLIANLGWLFAATGVGYFLTYEWLHFAYHQPEASWIGRNPIVARLRRHHAVHHDPHRMRRVNFNITFPIADWLFGTSARD
jgi:hypothetical protein